MRNKLQKLLNKLDGKNEATMKVIADFDVSVKSLRDKLEADISMATLEEVKKHIDRLRRTINLSPLLEQVESLQANFKQNALDTLREVENKTAQLQTAIKVGDATLDEKIIPLAEKSNTLERGFNAFAKQNIEDLTSIKKNVFTINEKLPTLVDKKVVDDLEDKIEKGDEDSKDYTDKTRIELLNKLADKGGGNMNRNISIGSNSSVLSRYTDINILAGSNVTLSYSNNNTTKNLDLTIAATGGDGTVRSISTITVSSVAAATANTDQVVLCNGGVQLTLPTAVSNTNLYTIKNIGSSSVLVGTTGGQTIDGDTTVIMPVQYTSVDIVSDNANWHIT